MRKHFQSGFKKCYLDLLFWSIVYVNVQGSTLPGGSEGKESACSAGDPGSTPVLGRFPGGGHGNPPQYSCLENPLGQRNLTGYCPWGFKELDLTEPLSLQPPGTPTPQPPLSPSRHSPSCIRPVFLTLTQVNSLVLSSRLFFFQTLKNTLYFKYQIRV